MQPAVKGAGVEVRPGQFTVLLPQGLVQNVEDGQWTAALDAASTNEWMDNELKVLGEI